MQRWKASLTWVSANWGGMHGLVGQPISSRAHSEGMRPTDDSPCIRVTIGLPLSGHSVPSVDSSCVNRTRMEESSQHFPVCRFSALLFCCLFLRNVRGCYLCTNSRENLASTGASPLLTEAQSGPQATERVQAADSR